MITLEYFAKLIADAGYGVLGQNLFIHHMPETIPGGIVLRGPLQGVPLNHYIPGYYKGSFQLIVRSSDHASGQALSDQVSALLYFENRDVLDDQGALIMRINHVFPRVKPIVYPRLPNNSIEWSITFDVNWIEL
jgi:hypothetical protein